MNLISLIRLNLSHNPLGQIPFELGQLINLHELWLTNLNLYDIPLNVFTHLNQLEKLSLKSNHLRRLPTDIGQLIELRWLSIEDNELNDLPDCLQDCLNLSYLNLNGNHVIHIPSVIGKISSLNIVCLQRNAIAEINDDTLLMFSNMTKVDLRENPLVEKPKHWKVSSIKKKQEQLKTILFQGLEFIKLGRCIDVTSFDDENNSESSDSSQDDHVE
jgi:leucine-rich repeat protein SHOC2